MVGILCLRDLDESFFCEFIQLTSTHLYFSHLNNCKAWLKYNSSKGKHFLMLVSSHISFIYNFKSSTKLPPGHFSNEQRWSSTPRLWMQNKHHGWTLSPLASCCSQPLTSAAAFQSVPNGENWAALSGKELHPRASTSFGFTDFLEVIQLFRAAELSVNPASHRPAPRHWPPGPGQQLVQGGLFVGQLEEGALGAVQASRGQGCRQGHCRGVSLDTNPSTMTSNHFFHQRQGGREGEQRRKEKISRTTIQRMWLGKNESLLKAVIKVVHLCNQSQ